MGLFKKANPELEQTVLQNMMDSELLNMLVNTITSNPDATWMTAGQCGDSGWRKVIVKPTGFIIEIPGAYQRGDESSCAAINFESAGYTRLDAYCDQKGKPIISRSRMCYLYATAIQRKLVQVLGNCQFGEVKNNRDMNQLSDNNLFFAIDLMMDVGASAEFMYRVPVPTASSLF